MVWVIYWALIGGGDAMLSRPAYAPELWERHEVELRGAEVPEDVFENGVRLEWESLAPEVVALLQQAWADDEDVSAAADRAERSFARSHGPEIY